MVLMPLSMAKTYHMNLLAVSESTDKPQGMVADLYLDLVPGTGRVFIDTFPFTRVDTQISTRFGRSIACSYLQLDCSRLDFFYTIRSNSAIVGGPSAGSALAVLTAAALEDRPFDKKIAITGTINSGGLIGPVGGIQDKIKAAADYNLSKVLIPKGERYVTNDVNGTNVTVDLYEYGKNLGIEVLEVSTIDEAYYQFTGVSHKKDYKEVNMTPQYTDTMEKISGQLCKRSEALSAKVAQAGSANFLSAQNLTEKAHLAESMGEYYSRASYCFGANIRLTDQILKESNISIEKLKEKIVAVGDNITVFEANIEARKLATLTDLQTYEIVRERLIDSENYLNLSSESLNSNETADSVYFLSYGIERLYSAASWSSFFGLEGKNLVLNQATLRNSCIEKLSEAEERYQYVQLYLPNQLSDTRALLDRVYEDQKSGEYSLCLFEASKAKAEADVVLGIIGISGEQVKSYLDTKLSLANDQIASQLDKGNLPILGYSYFEYAKTLRDSDIYSALIYTEYALELSNLDIYFSNEKKKTITLPDKRFFWVFVLGLAIGIAIGFIAWPKNRNEQDHISIKIRRTKRLPRINKLKRKQ